MSSTVPTRIQTVPSGQTSSELNERNAGNASPSELGFEPAPDGGATAWLVAAGGGAIFFCCLGFTNSFGAFEEYHLTHQLSDKTPDDVAWIGSTAVFLQFAVAVVAGPMFDRFGAKVWAAHH
jgi:hypothetical protein